MDPLESTTHSFIVKIWSERAGRRGERAIWRGRISHVPDGAYRSLKCLGDIVFFIIPYLTRLGVRPGLGWWLNERLCTLIRLLRARR